MNISRRNLLFAFGIGAATGEFRHILDDRSVLQNLKLKFNNHNVTLNNLEEACGAFQTMMIAEGMNEIVKGGTKLNDRMRYLYDYIRDTSIRNGFEFDRVFRESNGKFVFDVRDINIYRSFISGIINNPNGTPPAPAQQEIMASPILKI